MNDDITEQRSPHRLFETSACGDTETEIELAALDQARGFFGNDKRLEVVRTYSILTAENSPLAGGKKHRATIWVRVFES
jgi:hypothetical protein